MDENRVLEIIERWYAGRYQERHGLVTSYDPNKYLAKVTFQPEGQESGWIPVETGHIGEGYGIVIGLQPGSGAGALGQQQSGSTGQSGQNQQASGDQVVVRYQEGDVESGKIVQRVHSDKDTPPPCQAGEIIIWTKFKRDSNPGPDAAQTGQQNSQGQKIYFKNDGSISWTDGNGATNAFDGKGNHTLTCKNHTINASGDRTVNIDGKDTVTIKGNKSVTIKGQRSDNVSGSWMTKAANSVWSWLTSENSVIT